MTTLLGTCPTCGTSDTRIQCLDEHGQLVDVDRVELRPGTVTNVSFEHERWCPAVDERALAAIRRQRANER